MKKERRESVRKTEDIYEGSSAISVKQKLILDALLREYEIALMLDMSNDTYEIFKLTGRFARSLSTMFRDKFSITMLEIADGCIYSYDYDLFIGAVSIENLRARLESDGFCSFVFRAITSRGPEYFRMRIIKAEEGQRAFVGVSCIQDEMSRELQQRRLFEGALDRARSADSAKSTFLTNMSHDIRTPMNAIIGFTNIASTHLDDRDRVKDALDKIRTSSNHLLNLINDVLDMSRIESGRITINENRCDLRKIIENIRGIMMPQMTGKDLEFTVDMETVADPEVYCDETRVTQILLNLLALRMMMVCSERTEISHLCKNCGILHVVAEAYAYDERRTCVYTEIGYCVEYVLDYCGVSVGRLEDLCASGEAASAACEVCADLKIAVVRDYLPVQPWHTLAGVVSGIALLKPVHCVLTERRRESCF